MYDAGIRQKYEERLANLPIFPHLLLNLFYVALLRAFGHKLAALQGISVPKKVRVYLKANVAKLVFRPVSIRSSRS